MHSHSRSFPHRRARLTLAAAALSVLSCGSSDASSARSESGDTSTPADDGLGDGLGSDATQDVAQDVAQDAPEGAADGLTQDVTEDVAQGDTGPATPTRRTLSGPLAYTLTFSDEAKASGAKDCTYARNYTLHEDATVPWIFPEATEVFFGTTALENAECGAQVGAAPSSTVWLAVFGGSFGVAGVGLQSAIGPAVVNGDTVTVTTGFTDVGVTATASGVFTYGTEPGLAAEGTIPEGAYACGWPRANPPAYTGPNDLVVGQTLPDGSFDDHCGERVRLHDFKGTYFVIDTSASDCGPCQYLAEYEEHAFIADMKTNGIDVRVITLLRPYLDQPCIVGTTSTLTDWRAQYKLDEPVLLDRCYSASMQLGHGKGAGLFGDGIEHMPATIAVRPDLTVLKFGIGSDFVAVRDAILQDAGK